MGNVNNNLKTIRERKHISQQEVSDYLGITRQAYSHYEVGRRKPDYETLLKLAEFFEVSVLDLLEEEKAPTSEGEHKNRTKNLSMKIGEKLRMISASNLQRARQSSGYSVEKAARLADVDSKVIIGMENGTLDLKYGDKLLESLCDIYNTTPREILDSGDEDYLTDDEIKFALFGGYSGITDEMYNEVLQFAKFVKKREEQKKKE